MLRPRLTKAGNGGRESDFSSFPKCHTHLDDAGRYNMQGVIRWFFHSTITLSVPPRPKVSGWYISSAFAGGTTNTPGVVARATYE